MHLFFVSLMGTIVTVWSLLRLWRPEPVLGAMDTLGRAGLLALDGRGVRIGPDGASSPSCSRWN